MILIYRVHSYKFVVNGTRVVVSKSVAANRYGAKFP